MIDPVTLNTHIKYISQLLTEHGIKNKKYFSREEVSWIQIKTDQTYYLYFYPGVVNQPEIRLALVGSRGIVVQSADTFYDFDDLSNPKAYQWLIQIIRSILQANSLINKYSLGKRG